MNRKYIFADVTSKEIAEGLVLLVFGLSLLGSLVLFGWQILYWFKNGFWVAIPFKEAFVYFDVDLTRVYNPTDWYGLARAAQSIIEDIPLTFAILSIPSCIALLLQELIFDSGNS